MKRIIIISILSINLFAQDNALSNLKDKLKSDSILIASSIKDKYETEKERNNIIDLECKKLINEYKKLSIEKELINSFVVKNCNEYIIDYLKYKN